MAGGSAAFARRAPRWPRHVLPDMTQHSLKCVRNRGSSVVVVVSVRSQSSAGARRVRHSIVAVGSALAVSEPAHLSIIGQSSAAGGPVTAGVIDAQAHRSPHTCLLREDVDLGPGPRLCRGEPGPHPLRSGIGDDPHVVERDGLARRHRGVRREQRPRTSGSPSADGSTHRSPASSTRDSPRVARSTSPTSHGGTSPARADGVCFPHASPMGPHP